MTSPHDRFEFDGEAGRDGQPRRKGPLGSFDRLTGSPGDSNDDGGGDQRPRGNAGDAGRVGRSRREREDDGVDQFH